MSEPVLLVENQGPVQILTLNRPEALNALDEELLDALTEHFVNLADNFSTRVVILRANGRAFCAGLDLKGWKNLNQDGPVHRSWRTQRKIVNVVRLMRKCPQPIIGLGHGSACGGGFSLLLACDVRYAAPSLKMNAAYIRIGLGGCDIACSYFLPRLVGVSTASEFILSGKFMDANRAYRCNLVSEIVEEDKLLDTAMELANEMLKTAPMGLRVTKDALNLNIDAQSFEHAVALEDRQQVMLVQTTDHREAVDAFLEKRNPIFRDS